MYMYNVHVGMGTTCTCRCYMYSRWGQKSIVFSTCACYRKFVIFRVKFLSFKVEIYLSTKIQLQVTCTLYIRCCHSLPGK